MFDVNKDGRLTELELRQILQSAYPSITDLNVNCLFKQADVNGRGSITYGVYLTLPTLIATYEAQGEAQVLPFCSFYSILSILTTQCLYFVSGYLPAKS